MRPGCVYERERLFDVRVQSRLDTISDVEHDPKPVRRVAQFLDNSPDKEIGFAHIRIVGRGRYRPH